MSYTICTVKGTILDSGNNPLSGKLIIKLDSNIINENTTPDGFLTTFERSYTIAGGVVNIPLVESETQNTTYWFQFFPLVTSPSTYATESIHDFHAVIPDATEVEYQVIAKETGITTKNLDVSALYVSRQILTNSVLSPLIFQAAQLYRQTSKPLSGITDGALWFQFNKGLVWLYSQALNKWLSVLLNVGVVRRNVSTAQIIDIPILWSGQPGLLLSQISIEFTVLAAPNDASNRWIVKTGRKTHNSETVIQIGSDINSNTQSSGIKQKFNIAYALPFTSIEADVFTLELVKTGSPGNISINATFLYSFFETYP